MSWQDRLSADDDRREANAAARFNHYANKGRPKRLFIAAGILLAIIVTIWMLLRLLK